MQPSSGPKADETNDNTNIRSSSLHYQHKHLPWQVMTLKSSHERSMKDFGATPRRPLLQTSWDPCVSNALLSDHLQDVTTYCATGQYLNATLPLTFRGQWTSASHGSFGDSVFLYKPPLGPVLSTSRTLIRTVGFATSVPCGPSPSLMSLLRVATGHRFEEASRKQV